MKAPFHSFLDQIGYKSLRPLSLPRQFGLSTADSVTYVVLCRERTTERLMVAKFWSHALESCATREVCAMQSLGELKITPQLCAFFTIDSGLVALRPYLSGATLTEFGQQREAAMDREQVFRCLTVLVNRFHQLGWVHRDLNPSNIIVMKGGGLQILDWDLAEKIGAQDTKSFAPKGTIGFSFSNDQETLVTQDLAALHRIREFLGLSSNAISSKPHRRSWWKTLLSAQP